MVSDDEHDSVIDLADDFQNIDEILSPTSIGKNVEIIAS